MRWTLITQRTRGEPCLWEPSWSTRNGKPQGRQPVASLLTFLGSSLETYSCCVIDCIYTQRTMPDPFDCSISTFLKWKDLFLLSLQMWMVHGLLISQILSNYVKLFLCVLNYVFMYVKGKCVQCSQRPEEAMRSRGRELIEGRPDVDTGTWTWVFCQDSISS